MTRRTEALLAVLLIFCCLTGCAADVGGTRAGRTATIVAAKTTPTPSYPTIPASATTLGGSVVSFDKKFGANNCCYRNGWQYQGPFGQQRLTII